MGFRVRGVKVFEPLTRNRKLRKADLSCFSHAWKFFAARAISSGLGGVLVASVAPVFCFLTSGGFRNSLFWGPYNKDPIQGTILGSPIFGNTHRNEPVSR